MRKHLFHILMCYLALCTSADLFSQSATENIISPRTDFWSNWYLEAGGGSQILMSRDANELSFAERLTPAVSLSAGKWFSPSWGLRVQAQGYSLNGYSTTKGIYIANPLDNNFVYGPNDPVRDIVPINPDGSYRHYLRYLNMHIDFRASVMNLLTNNQTKSRWDIIPGVGIGYMQLFEYKGTPKNGVITTNFSVMGKYRISKNFDLNLEAQAAVMPDQFDGRIAGRIHENNCAVTLGVTYRFKKRGFKPTQYTYVPRETLPTVVTKTDTVVVTKIVEKEIEKKVFIEPFLLAFIQFGFDSYIPNGKQDIMYANILKYLELNPDNKIRVNGYSDPIGASDYNRNLSMKRAVCIRDILVKKYGVQANRIEVQGIGADAQPYENAKWNRVVIVTSIEK